MKSGTLFQSIFLPFKKIHYENFLPFQLSLKYIVMRNEDTVFCRLSMRNVIMCESKKFPVLCRSREETGESAIDS